MQGRVIVNPYVVSQATAAGEVADASPLALPKPVTIKNPYVK
jgi:hypothetical protein